MMFTDCPKSTHNLYTPHRFKTTRPRRRSVLLYKPPSDTAIGPSAPGGAPGRFRRSRPPHDSTSFSLHTWFLANLPLNRSTRQNYGEKATSLILHGMTVPLHTTAQRKAECRSCPRIRALSAWRCSHLPHPLVEDRRVVRSLPRRGGLSLFHAMGS